MNKNLSNLMPTFSTAGIWVPNGVSDPVTHNQVAIANAFYSPIDLPNGRTEPPRVCRRLFGLSHAASLCSSSLA